MSRAYIKLIRPPRVVNTSCITAENVRVFVHESAQSLVINVCVFCGADEQSHDSYEL